MWLPAYGGVWRIDQTDFTPKTLIRVPIGDLPGHIAYGSRSVWVVTASGQIARIRAATNAVDPDAVQFPTSRPARDIAFAQGALWVSSNTQPSANLSEVSPATDHIIATKSLPGTVNWLAGNRTTLLADYTDQQTRHYVLAAILPDGTIRRTIRSTTPIVAATITGDTVWALIWDGR